MIQKIISDKKTLAAIGLALTAIAFRFLPHPPNFSPLISIAFFSGFAFKKPLLAIGLPLISIFISDLFLGLHSTIISVYLSLAFIVGLGWLIKTHLKSKVTSLATGIFTGSIIFFVTTNFSVWMLTPFYEKSSLGLIQCYVAAIPFFQNTLTSTLLYSSLLFLGFHLVKIKVSVSSNELS